MSQLLADKKGLIFGVLDEHSLAWHVAMRCKENGAKLVLSNTTIAMELGTIRELASNNQIPIIVCDVTNVNDITHLLQEAQKHLGGKIDFILHSVAQSLNLRRHKPYWQINYDYFFKTIDISAFSLHKLLQKCLDIDAISEGGSVVTLTYLASERYFNGYNDMADAKALLESIVRQMGAIYGTQKKVRINAISQSATQTKAGSQWAEQDFFYAYANDLSPLGSADADDCADLCVALFSDLTRKITMQTIYNDGGFSHTMMTKAMIDDFREISYKKHMQ